MAGGAGEVLEGMNAGLTANMVAGMSPGGIAGSLMSRGSAIGAPIASSAAGMLGLDPMSIGLSAGKFMWNRGAGVLGAGAVGMGAMAGAGLIGAGVQYVGGQMMQGAQQQLGLNQNLARNFNFQNSQGGMGFTSNQGYQIGDALRSMTGVQGAGGEVATFGELSKLASNMGRMGMGQNVRTVADFKEKFKQMVDTLKTVAHDMGTSLEEAQKMMVSMKNSGIFNKGDQLRMSGGMRLGAMAGGLATSEMSGMANIGSQISRSIGGLGRAGAFAGMKTIEQIGIAGKIGAISEEDIYNATGQTGAEGRQALATAQLQQSASFMQSGRGRRFLASIAGKNGTLNENSVAEWMAGGDMTTGRTMQMAHENLSGVGRANFIRNEGRLRGAALEKFGGIAQSMVYKQWLSSRGYTPDDMDDRSMLAFQRFSGMGRDEADLAIKQVNAMPELMHEMQMSERGLKYSDMQAQRRNKTGIEGMKRKWKGIKEQVQDEFQTAGAHLMESGEEMLEEWFNEMSGIYVKNTTEGLDEIIKQERSSLGGAGHEATMRQMFGIGQKGGAGGYMGLAPGTGGDIRKSLQTDQAKAKNLGLTLAAAGGIADLDTVKFAENNRDLVKFMAATSLGNPADMVSSFGKQLEEAAKGDPKAAAVLEKFKSKSEADKVRMVQQLQRSAGVVKEGQLLTSLIKEGKGIDYADVGRYRSKGQAEEAIGMAYQGKDFNPATYFTDEAEADRAGYLAQGVGLLTKGVANMSGLGFAGNIASLFGADNYEKKILDKATAFTQRFVDKQNGRLGENKAIGRALMDKTNQKILSDLSNGKGRGEALDEITRLASVEGPDGKVDEVSVASRDILARQFVATDEKYQNAFTATPGLYGATENEAVEAYDKLSGYKANADTIEGKNGMVHRMVVLNKLKRAHANIEQANETQLANLTEYMTNIQQQKTKDVEQRVAQGVLKPVSTTDGKIRYELGAEGEKQRAAMPEWQKSVFDMSNKLLTKDYIGDMQGRSDKDFIKSLDAKERKIYESKTGAAKDLFRAHKDMSDAAGAEDKDNVELNRAISGWSIDQKRQYMRDHPGTKEAMAAGLSIGQQDRWNNALKGTQGKGGQWAAAAKILGVSIDEDQLKGLDAAGKKSAQKNIELGLAQNGGKPLTKGQRDRLAAEGAAIGQADAFLKAGGMEGLSSESKLELKKALGQSNEGLKAGALAEWSKRDDVKKAASERKQAEAREDPSYAALDDIRKATDKQNDILKDILLANKDVSQAVKDKYKDEPEAK